MRGAALEVLRDVLSTELEQLRMRHSMGKSILDFMGAAAPAFGMIGTLIGLVQMLSNLMYILMAQRGQDVPVFAATIAFENVSGGMTGVAFIAYLSSLCSPGFAKFQSKNR